MVGSYQQDRGVVRSPMCRDALILHQVTPTPLANRPKAMPQRTKARKADGGKRQHLLGTGQPWAPLWPQRAWHGLVQLVVVVRQDDDDGACDFVAADA